MRRHLRLLLIFLSLFIPFLFVYDRIVPNNGYEITGKINNLFTRKPHHPRIVLRDGQGWEPCQPIYGKVVVFVMYAEMSLKNGFYGVALESLHCYLKGRNYELKFINIDTDSRVNKACGKHQQLFFKKHCAAAEYLQDSNWLLVLDADTGVVNPHHCIEEWIDDRVNLIFYERFFNWEIASGNYLAKNSIFSHNFLKSWANYEFHMPENWNGADNGALQILLLKTLLPDAAQEIENCDFLWHNGTNYDGYMAYVVCVKLSLGATRLWPGKIRIYRRGHGWVRDGFLSNDKWGPSDFMFHGWKNSHVGQSGWESPFRKNLKSVNCGPNDDGWLWRPNKISTDQEIRKQLLLFEQSAGRTFPKTARVFPHLELPDVGNCYPFCENGTDSIVLV